MALNPIGGTTHEAGAQKAQRIERDHNYDVMNDLAAKKVGRGLGRISAKRLLPTACTAGMSARHVASGGRSLRRSLMAAGSWPRRISQTHH